jgi:NAD-dependent deacetylase
VGDGVQIPAPLTAALGAARRICVLTGAGISAESGVPTFRDAQTGLWAQYNPLDLATPEAFLRDPELVWRWYRWRRELVARAEPNAAHLALARLVDPSKVFTLVTQNVDGLHQRAGSSDVIEFHGNLFADRCFVEGIDVHPDPAEEVPHCPGCGALVRPGVVWFGEAIPVEALALSSAAAQACDVFLSIGTSALVYPAAGLVDMARQAGAITVEINPQPTELAASFDFTLPAPAGSVLPELVDSLQD